MSETPCEPKDVALAALANLMRLMGAELVAGRHRDDLTVFEQAMRAKVGAIQLAGCPPETVQAGLALASAQVEQILAQIRQQACAARPLAPPRATNRKGAGRPSLQ